MRNRFDNEMAHLNDLMIETGALCESAIANAIKALLEGDEKNAERAFDLEDKINKNERIIEELCLKLILREQPVATDLRQVSSALKMITDMERIGDQADDIAEIATLGNIRASDSMHIIREMSIAAIRMVTGSIDAYVKKDIDLARQVIQEDDEVDIFFNRAKSEASIMLITEQGRAEYVIDFLMVAKYLERIADHAVNIAEWVVYIVTGTHPDSELQEGAEHDNLHRRG